MRARFIYAVLASMVISALGEQLLRGQPQETLAAEAVHPSKESQALSSAKTPKNVINFFKGMIFKKPRAETSETEEVVGVSDWKEMGVMDSGEMLMSFLIWLLLYFLLAFYYHNSVLFYAAPEASKAELEERIHYKDFQGFKTGLFDCASYPDICFWSCCCPGIRWADTMSKLSIHRFWPAFWLLTGLMALAWIPVCTVVCHCIIAGYFAYHRQEFRAKFDFEEQGHGVCMKDCCAYLFCTCCAVAQEARHTREACTVNHPAIDREHMTPRHAEATAAN